MHSISDLKGRTWDLHMTLRHARVIESRLKVNVLSPESAEESILALVASPLKMIDILWILVEAQANERGISRDDFEDGFDGEAYLRAADVLGEAIVFFIQSVDPTRAKLWTALLRKSKVVATMQVTKLEQFLESDELDKVMERELSTSIEEAITTLRETNGKASGR